MSNKIITHVDGSQSFVTDDIVVIKNKENPKDQKTNPTDIKKLEDVEFKKGKVTHKKSKQ